jgi:hypothetical protein
MSRMPCSTYHSTVALAGARPEPFSATGRPLPREYSIKQSPPIPVLCGSTTHCIATAAIAASAALPPPRNTSSAAIVAIGCDVAAIPCAAIAADRPGMLKSRILIVPRVAAWALTGKAGLTGRRVACSALMHRPNLPVNSRHGNKIDHGWKFWDFAISVCNPAGSRRDPTDSTGSVVAAYAASLRARPHQSVAA